MSAELGATVSQVDGFGVVTAHGNLFKTQELLPTTTGGALTLTTPTSGVFTKLHPTLFVDIKGGNFDALDRATIGLTKVNQGSAGEITEQSSTTYDDPSALGLGHQSCNAVHQCGTFAYDAEGRVQQITYSDTLSPTRTAMFDPDGRVASVTSSVYGAQTYSYDSDGRLTQSVEPSSGGVTSSATLSYNYYANGWKTSVNVSSSGFSQAALFAYSYRSDGLTESQQINDTANALVGTTTLTFTRSTAGRVQSRSEAGPGSNPNTIASSYDAYGRPSGMSDPAGSYINAEYDATGHELGVGTSVGGVAAVASMAYTQRGELTKIATGVPNPAVTAYANGIGVTLPQAGWEGSTTWDPQMGVVLGSASDGGSGPSSNTTGSTFDAAGRSVAVSVTNSFPDGLGDGSDTEEANSSTKIYDDENHLVAATAGPLLGSGGQTYSQMLAYNWGPNGHPIQIGSTPINVTGTPSNMAFETLHWDGDQLLFTTDSSGQLDDIKVGSIADITPLDPGYKGITFYDRDFSGEVGFCHNATGAAGSGKTNPYLRTSKLGSLPTSPCAVTGHGQTMTGPSSIAWWSGEGMTVPGGRWATNGSAQVGHGTLIGMPRADGITDGLNVIQGVRSYDPTLGSWTTPDAYSGDVSAPASQKGYIWNDNNAVAYSDPGGFDAHVFFDPSDGDGAGDGYSNFYWQDNTDSGCYIDTLGTTYEAQYEGEEGDEEDETFEAASAYQPAYSAEELATGVNDWEGASRDQRRAQVARHIKHAVEFGTDWTTDDYLRSAGFYLRSARLPAGNREMVLQVKEADSLDPKWSRFYAYDQEDNILLIVTNGRISTFFRPVDGLNYFQNDTGSGHPVDVIPALLPGQ